LRSPRSSLCRSLTPSLNTLSVCGHYAQDPSVAATGGGGNGGFDNPFSAPEPAGAGAFTPPVIPVTPSSPAVVSAGGGGAYDNAAYESSAPAPTNTFGAYDSGVPAYGGGGGGGGNGASAYGGDAYTVRSVCASLLSHPISHLPRIHGLSLACLLPLSVIPVREGGEEEEAEREREREREREKERERERVERDSFN
jgi:hypothetical protein